MKDSSKENPVIRSTVRRRNQEEARRRTLTDRARLKFAGGALLSGAATAGAIFIFAVAQRDVSLLVEAGEVAAVTGAVGFSGWGAADLHEAADASRNAARLTQALAQLELDAGEFVGPGSEAFGPVLPSLEPKAANA